MISYEITIRLIKMDPTTITDITTPMDSVKNILNKLVKSQLLENTYCAVAG